MAQKDDDLDLDVETAPVKSAGGWKKIVLLSVAVLVLVGVSVGATMWLLHRGAPAATAESAKAEHANTKKSKTAKKTASKKGEAKRTPHYLNLDPPFVVNLNDNSGVRFLQVAVSVMAYDAAKLDKVKENLPIVRNYLMLLFSSQKFADIKTREGKIKLQEEALKAVRKALVDSTGEPQVDALYLPSIVGQ